jgi:Outer membrane protein beta-barrel domain
MQHILRRKIVYILAAVIMLPLIGKSQLWRGELNLPDHDDKPYHFGINIGINRSHFNFEHHPRFLLYDSVMTVESINSTGLNLAWLVNFRLGEHFDIRTYPLNLTFTEKAFEYNIKYPDFDEKNPIVKKVQSISLSLPVQLKFSSDRINNFKVYTIAGGKIDYDLAANAGARKAENLIKLKKLDFGVELGIGFHFYFPVFVLTPELKAGWGFSDLHSRDVNLKYSNVLSHINSRMISFSITVE